MDYFQIAAFKELKYHLSDMCKTEIYVYDKLFKRRFSSIKLLSITYFKSKPIVIFEMDRNSPYYRYYTMIFDNTGKLIKEFYSISFNNAIATIKHDNV